MHWLWQHVSQLADIATIAGILFLWFQVRVHWRSERVTKAPVLVAIEKTENMQPSRLLGVENVGLGPAIAVVAFQPWDGNDKPQVLGQWGWRSQDLVDR